VSIQSVAASHEEGFSELGAQAAFREENFSGVDKPFGKIQRFRTPGGARGNERTSQLGLQRDCLGRRGAAFCAREAKRPEVE
jgi:hypothetical protein